MSDNVTSFSGAVRWVPIAPGESVDYDMHIGPNNELRVVTELGEMVVEFEDDIRVCRAKPAPDWSQEPPTQPGDWWLWDSAWGSSRPKLIAAWKPSPTLNLMFTIDNIHTPVNQYCRQSSTLWWLPATVPQPPKGTG